MNDQADDENTQSAIVFYIVAVIVFASTAWLAFFSTQSPTVSAVLYLNLFALALYDIRFFRLPNILTATLFIIGVVSLFTSPPFSITDHIIGAAVGLLLFPTLNFFYRRFRGHDGIGLGDAKLLAGLGLWLGWQALPSLLLVASLSALLYAFVRFLVIPKSNGKVNLAEPLPFGAFLCFGGWLSWLFLPL